MGVSRDAVLAAILERGACASEPTGARPEARSDPARRSGATAAGLGRARVGLAERAAGP